MAKGRAGRTYTRDSNGRFAGGGSTGSQRPASKPAPRGRNRLTRDNSGRITGTGDGATARGGRLRTGAGNLRATQTARLKGQGGKVRNPRRGGAQAEAMRATAMPSGQGRVPAARRPGSMTSMLRNTLQSLAKSDARWIREVESITGEKIRVPRRAPAVQGAAVQAQGRGSVAATLRGSLRQLAQSDARMMRGVADLAKPSAKGALRGGGAGKAGKSLPPTRRRKP